MANVGEHGKLVALKLDQVEDYVYCRDYQEYGSRPSVCGEVWLRTPIE